MTIKYLQFLFHWMPVAEFKAIRTALRGEERQFFADKAQEFFDRIQSMPTTGEQDGKGDAAVAYLHYFLRTCDWYILENDSNLEGEGQWRAFGYANLGDPECAEFGYLDLAEIISVGAELDLHFTPQTIQQLKQAGRIPHR